LVLKAKFWGHSVLWGFVLFIGWVKDAQLRVTWGIAWNELLLLRPLQQQACSNETKKGPLRLTTTKGATHDK
jgi:hypothetical protein